MKDITRKVELILQDYPRSRGDDNFLYTMFVYTYYPENVIERAEGFYVNICRKMQSLDTITRIRRKFNEQNKYLPAESVQKRRTQRANELHREYNHQETLSEMARMDNEFNKLTAERLF